MILLAPIVSVSLIRVLSVYALLLCSLVSCTSPDLFEGPTYTVTVRYGDTVESLAHIYGLTSYDLIALNNLKSPYQLTAGQSFLVPHRSHGLNAPSQGTLQSYRGTAGRGTLQSYSSQSKAPQPKTYPVAEVDKKHVFTPSQGLGRDAKASEQKIAPKPQILGPELAFAWPMKGTLISGFGQKPGGLMNDGINIQGKVGTPVRSACEGTVAYADNKLKGFGHLVIIKHAHGWSTAYAHNSKLFVQKGQKVRKGQIIALCGEEGNVKSPQLHFEIRYQGRPVDPSPRLK